MQGQCCMFLLTYVVTVAIPFSVGFNIEVTNPVLYSGNQKDFFGYKVLQFISGTNKGIIVTAPLQRNGSGAICKPTTNQRSQCFSPNDISLGKEKIPVKHFGLSVAADSASSQFTACSPSVAHECYENSYLNSVCYKMSDNLKQISSFRPTFQACTKKTVDLVFLFDGSLSMSTDEFVKNKDFIEDIMANLKNTSIKFAAVQFSAVYRKVFDFNDDQAGTALDKLKAEPHMSSVTNTHSALKFVLEDILENQSAGASPDATKVLVLITDGDPSDTDKDRIIARYVKKRIIRFVIGVKVPNMDKFKTIASQPTSKYAFKIENYNGLPGILGNFQKRIFTIEGSSEARAADFTDEVAQSGFSAVFHNNILILGEVGSKGWRGSLKEHSEKEEMKIEDQDMDMDSYMGYSIAVGEKNNVHLYFTGAPRFKHTGQVLLFKNNGKDWTVAQRLYGDQIGSYFGAELCSVDINSDGDTDFLLVGAPQFYQRQEKREGQIYIYTLTEEMQLKSEQPRTVASMGRFGTTISSLADLNGDRLRDVAVGAPLEDDNRGVVYIYLGDRYRGIRSNFSQKIMGREIKPGLRFFGQAIDGGIDLGEDGLADIVIGSQGTAVVLRSKPVYNVMAHLSFLPEEISTDEFDCVDKSDENLPMVTLTVCFEMVETTNTTAGQMSSGLNISYTLNVDPTRQNFRGFFGTDKKARQLTTTYQLWDENTCFNYSIHMLKCVEDTLSPIDIKLMFSQVNSESASTVLNIESSRKAVAEVPFEKRCAKKDFCIAELEVDFNFMTSVLLVAEDNYFNVSVKLSNHGDDSYNTILTMYYPPGLSFSRMTVKEATRPTLHSCHDLDGVLDKTTCDVSHPVYYSRSAATFTTSFHILYDYEWNDTISMIVTGGSDNTNSNRTNSLTKSIPVQFEIKMAVTVKEGSTTYLNFTTEDAAPKKMEIIFKLANPGLKAYPLNVSLVFPTKLEHDFEMKDYEVSVQQNKTQCNIIEEKSEYCPPDNHCKIIVCDTFILDKESTTEFILSGHVHFRDLKQRAQNIAFMKKYTGENAAVKFKSFIYVSYDKQRYMLDSHTQENKDGSTKKSHETGLWKDNDPTRTWTEVRVELIILPNKLLIILTGVGVGILFLLIVTVIMAKLGCFKRRKFYREEEEETDTLAEFSPAAILSSLETEGKSDQPSEEKVPLDDGKTNGITPADTEKEL